MNPPTPVGPGDHDADRPTPVQISVGPPVLTINQSATFMVTDLTGEITGDGELGVFADDTRFVSYYAISANGEPWTPLTASATAHNAASVHLTNRTVPTEAGDLPEGTLSLTITRVVDDGIHEDLDVINFSGEPVGFQLEIALRSDFADLFEVKAHRFVRRGHIHTEWDEESCELHTSYTNGDFYRRFTFHTFSNDTRADYANGRVTFPIELAPGASWHTCCEYVLARHDRVRAPSHEHPSGGADEVQRRWLSAATTLTSSNEDVYRLFRRSVEDLGAMRLRDLDSGPDVWLPAAGVPWFVTVFGRDSLIVSLQAMMVHSCLALGTLGTLAGLQASEYDDWRDAEPGKIRHEIRFGELAHLKRIPHTPYYGTADATPLFLIALHEAWRWRGDLSLLREHRDVALRCLEWIDRDGDFDGDGFQEYRTRSAVGYENMGWKDAGDAVVYPDGRQVAQPKALCELQGYVFDAWMRTAEVFDALDEPDRAVELRGKAVELQQRFEHAFWCEDTGFYAFALDADKQPVTTISSNAGHLLWSGIVGPERAERVVRRLLEPDMWSGWGIRTLSSDNPAYNPLSYQRGSVWPHDNGIIAMGFKRYGFAAEAARVARDISGAASAFANHRLPELYAGIERQPASFPVLYPGANVPQAWAAGTVFHLLQAVLGLQADAPGGRLFVDPALPEWLPDVTLHSVKVGAGVLDLRFWREGDQSRWEVLDRIGGVEVEEQSWRPWTPSSGLRDGTNDG